MADYINTAKGVQALASKFRAILELADALEQVGSIENAAADAARKRDENIAAATAEQNRLEVLRDAVAELENQRLAAEEEAQNASRAVGDDARKIKAEADLKARAIIETAQHEASVLIERAKKVVDEEHVKARDANAELGRINAERIQAERELEAIRKQIADAKEQAANIFRAVSS